MHAHRPYLSRRDLLRAGGGVLLGSGIYTALHHWRRHEGGLRARVCVARAPEYNDALAGCIQDALAEIGVTRRRVRGKRILVKPNLVETARGQAHINTHPSIVLALVDVLRRLDAACVVVAEGQGHRRDSQLVLEESGMGAALRAAGIPFVDLNHDEIIRVPNAGRQTSLRHLYLPQTVVEADWLVSVPKLKTHHWAGMTCSMKNLFGVMPGIVYGWPKNVLHYEGIPRAILDINATVKAAFAVVDGIVGMEGDGPIMGTAKPAHCLILGRNLTAVDATAARVMGLNPYGIPYLRSASGRLGPIREENISQAGETVANVRTPFRVLDAPHLRSVVAG